MSTIKIFSVKDSVTELEADTFSLEKELQNKIEGNMSQFFQVDFLTSEYIFNGGRIDSLGIDENNSPVIFEYKRSMNENVINQGLYYLEWLLDHRGDFEILVRDKYTLERASKIEWDNPVVYCIANEFTKFDVNAVKQMQRNIRLVEYKKYNDLLVFDFLNLDLKVKPINANDNKKATAKTITYRMENLNSDLKPILEQLRTYIQSLSEDVSEVITQQYLAYKKINNFATVDLTTDKITLYLRLNPKNLQLAHNMRDVTKIGHFGTGDLEIVIRIPEDLKLAEEFLDLAYNKN